jgi:uncharacterized membrane protein YcjF (UPF0283 family)
MLAQEDGRGKKGKCPKCNHLVVVPFTTKGRPAISADTPEQLQQVKEAVATATLDTAQYSSDDVVKLYGARPGWLIPTYDELSLFLMAVTFILLCAVNSQPRNWIRHFFSQVHDWVVYIFVLLFLAGLGLSLYHVFTRREKTFFEKQLMMLFAVLTNAGTGIISGWYILKSNDVRDWQLVFPIWNIINGALLLLMLRLKIIDEECISDRDANATEVVIGLIAVLIIFVFCNYVFKLYWAITFSICIVYTTSFDRALQNVFPGLANRPYEQTP